MQAILGLAKMQTLQRETLDMIVKNLIDLSMCARTMLGLITQEREENLSPVLKKELYILREVWGKPR